MCTGSVCGCEILGIALPRLNLVNAMLKLGHIAVLIKYLITLRNKKYIHYNMIELTQFCWCLSQA